MPPINLGEFNQPIDQRVKLERVKGIEPLSKAWEALVLPLNYTRVGGDEQQG
jgi:hypothetical protein